MKRRPQVVAHRGSSAAHPDNGWAAFEAAVAEGADAIECDVQATRDGVLVVRHDLNLGARVVPDMTALEVRDVEPGVATLSDVMAWARRVGTDLLVEVKEPGATVAVAQLIAGSGWRERTVLGSFHGPTLAGAKATAPSVRTSFLIGSVVAADDLIRLAAAYRADGVHLCWESRAARPHRLVDAATIERLRDAKLDITLWHEEREEELRALVALEPDAICTNTPAVLRRIVDAHRKHTPHGGAKEIVSKATT
jgi:glycerophosphoryl diester phosphodiesterase